VPLFVLSKLFSSLWVSRNGSASDWCALQEALYKCIDTIQYNAFITFYHLFPQQFWFAHPIFLTSLHQWRLLRISLVPYLVLQYEVLCVIFWSRIVQVENPQYSVNRSQSVCKYSKENVLYDGPTVCIAPPLLLSDCLVSSLQCFCKKIGAGTQTIGASAKWGN